MDFGLGGLFGAAGSIGGAAIAADAQRYTADTNWAIALTNYYAREREKWDAKLTARRMEAKTDLGSVDAQGTETRFIPGVGWRTELSDENQGIQARMQAETLKRLGPDAQRGRQQAERNELRQIREEDKAKALFEEMRKTPSIKASTIEAQLGDAMTAGIDEGFDKTSAIASRQAMRTKNPSGGRILREIALQRGKAVGDIQKNARQQAMTITSQLNNADDKEKANLYNMFATRAANLPGQQPTPTSIGTNETLLAQMRNSTNQSDNAFKAAQMEGGRLPFVPPNYGTANLVGAAGASLRGLFNEADRGYGDYYEDRERGNTGSRF